MKPASNTLLLVNRHAQIRSIELNPRRTTVLAVSLILAVCGILFFCGYHSGIRTEAGNRLSGIVELRTLFLLQQTEIARVRQTATANLDALALRLGDIQAQLLRLDALGERLASQSGIDADEFDFSVPLTDGVPLNTAASNMTAIPDFLDRIDELAVEVQERETRLAALERFVMDRNLRERIIPSGSAVEHGLLTSKYGRRIDPFTGKPDQHKGIDVAAKEGSRILALGDGVVTWSGERPGYGNLVEINHGYGYVTRYGHNQQLLANIGDMISKGQAVALMGSTGRSTGPHVHVEVVHDGQLVNPANYLDILQSAMGVRCNDAGHSCTRTAVGNGDE